MNNILDKINVPFDEISIPSKGIFYKDKKSSFLVKYITAKEENVLTSPSLVESGRAIEMVMSSCIIDWDYDIKDILVGDKNAVLLYLRSTSYGDDFKFKYSCPNCNKESDGSFKLSSLEIKEVSETPNEDGEFEYTLPKMLLKFSKDTEPEEVVIKFKPMTIGDEIEVSRIVREEKRIIGNVEVDNNVEAKYRVQITSINGNDNKEFIEKIIKRMPISDSSKLREYMREVEPGVDNIVSSCCHNCQHVSNNAFPMENDFFGLSPEYKQNMMDEIFLIGYYGKGGITRDDAYNMPVYERRWTMERISEEVDKKNKAEKAAANSAKK